MEEKAIKDHQPCPDCESSDALAIYSDHTYCFSCFERKWTVEAEVIPMEPKVKKPSLKWADRKISKAVSNFYDVQVTYDSVEFPYFFDGLQVATKYRDSQKNFKTKGDFTESEMFGIHTMSKAKNHEVGNTVIITEGESDALSAFQIANRIKPDAEHIALKKTLVPVFSIKSGVSSAERDIKANLVLLEKFERIFICFDSDDQGKLAS